VRLWSLADFDRDLLENGGGWFKASLMIALFARYDRQDGRPSPYVNLVFRA